MGKASDDYSGYVLIFLYPVLAGVLLLFAVPGSALFCVGARDTHKVRSRMNETSETTF